MVTSTNEFYMLQRIVFEADPQRAPLYFSDEGSFQVNSSQSGLLEARKKVSFDSYFNSFPECHLKYLDEEPIQILLKLSGRGSALLKIVRRHSGLEESLLVSQTIDLQETETSFSVRALKEGAGFLSFSLEAVTDSPVFLSQAGWWVSQTQEPTDVKLAVIICTYKREDAVKNTIHRIVSSDLPELSEVPIYLVDHASTLRTDELSSRVILFHQANFGGAGGFKRGIEEASQAEKFSHFLLMDDDIELMDETLAKTIRWLSVLKKNTSLSGTMLDGRDPTRIWESGGFYHSGRNVSRLQNLSVSKLNSDVMEKLSQAGFSHYGAWWYFCFPSLAIKKIGFPMPWFIRWDDAEYGIRLARSKYPTLSLPGLGVWHDPFYVKTGEWQLYYSVRNRLMLNGIHFLPTFSHLSFVKLLVEIGKLFLINDYVSIKIFILAMEDYLSGLIFQYRNKTDILHSLILKKLPHFYRTPLDEENLSQVYPGKKKAELLQSGWSMIRLLWVLLKHLLIGPKTEEEKKIFYLQGEYDLLRNAKNIAVINQWDKTVTHFTYDQEEARSLLIDVLWLTICFILKGQWLRFRYRKEFKKDCWSITQIYSQ